jgi:predicted adenine nucleotide alpha hydrolase (AANH) superfamily ATPase
VGGLLLHVCCAPCSAYSVPALRGLAPALTGYFYNPNIHPAEEHALRRETLERYAPALGLELVVAPDDGPGAWEAAVAGREEDRCRHCFALRLGATAREARRRGAAAFSTTLLFSIFQKHELIREVGEAVAGAEGVPFLYHDLRPGWQEGYERYRATGLHRQWYCGCRLSERERRARRRAGAGSPAA